MSLLLLLVLFSQNLDPSTWELVVEELEIELRREKDKEKQKRMEEGRYDSYDSRTKLSMERQSLSDYGTMKAKPASRMQNRILNMTLATTRNKGQTLLSLLPGSASNSMSSNDPLSNETTADVGADEFVLASDDPVENQKNFDGTLKIGEHNNKKY